jgi:HEAT repeat protein
MFQSTKYLVVTCLTTFALLLAVSASRGEDAQQALIDVLLSDASATEKAAACRQLKLVGGVEAVPALAALLTQQDLSHEARVALESMPQAEASAALREAIGQTTGTLRAGIVDSIGERRDEESVANLAKLLSDSDAQVAASAALALGKIGTTEAARLLNVAYQAAPKDRRTVIGDGRIRCANELLQAGKADDAATIFHRLSRRAEPALVRASALLGIIQSAGGERPKQVREFLASDDSMLRAAAATALPDLSTEDLRAVAAEMDGLPRESQIALVTAIRFRGDSFLAPLVIQAAESEDTALARASVAALGTVAGADGVDMLLRLTAGDDELSQVAWQSLEALRGQNVNAKLAAAMQTEQDPNRRLQLIKLLVDRSAHEAVSALIPQAGSDNATIRSAAIAAIGSLATPSDVSNVTRLLLESPEGRDRDELEKAVMLAVAQLPEADSRVGAVLAAVDIDSHAQQVAVLPTLGRIGGPKALELVEDALRSSNAELHEAGVRAISNWPDASVADQLRDLAQDATQQSHRIWALRAWIRVITLPGGASDAEKLAVLRQAMETASRAEERVLILQRASALRSLDTLHFLLPYLDQPAFAQDACRSVVELAHHKELREPNKADFDVALKKVLAICRSGDTVDRAKRYLQGH